MSENSWYLTSLFIQNRQLGWKLLWFTWVFNYTVSTSCNFRGNVYTWWPREQGRSWGKAQAPVPTGCRDKPVHSSSTLNLKQTAAESQGVTPNHLRWQIMGLIHSITLNHSPLELLPSLNKRMTLVRGPHTHLKLETVCSKTDIHMPVDIYFLKYSCP